MDKPTSFKDIYNCRNRFELDFSKCLDVAKNAGYKYMCFNEMIYEVADVSSILAPIMSESDLEKQNEKDTIKDNSNEIAIVMSMEKVANEVIEKLLKTYNKNEDFFNKELLKSEIKKYAKYMLEDIEIYQEELEVELTKNILYDITYGIEREEFYDEGKHWKNRKINWAR